MEEIVLKAVESSLAPQVRARNRATVEVLRELPGIRPTEYTESRMENAALLSGVLDYPSEVTASELVEMGVPENSVADCVFMAKERFMSEARHHIKISAAGSFYTIVKVCEWVGRLRENPKLAGKAKNLACPLVWRMPSPYGPWLKEELAKCGCEDEDLEKLVF